MLAFVRGHEVVPVCPEVLGGLPVPRKPAELVDGRVRCEDLSDVDEAFRRGARLALKQMERAGVELVILQPRSPSCGLRQVYDGTFSGKRIAGRGVFAQMLLDAGYRVTEATDYPDPQEG